MTLRDSDKVGWAKIPSCKTGYGILPIIASWTIAAISPPSMPRMAAPRICSDCASTMTFIRPRVSPNSLGPRHIGHWHFRDANLFTLFARLFLRYANAAELRIDEDGVGKHAPLDGGVLAVEKVVAQDAKIVIRNMGEGGATLDVANSIDAGDICFQVRVNAKETLVVGLDSGCGQIEFICIWRASYGDQKMGSLDGSRLATELESPA